MNAKSMNNAENDWIGTWLTRDGQYAVVTHHKKGVDVGDIAIGGNILAGYWQDGNSLISPSLDLVERKLEHERWNIPDCLKDVSIKASQGES